MTMDDLPCSYSPTPSQLSTTEGAPSPSDMASGMLGTPENIPSPTVCVPSPLSSHSTTNHVTDFRCLSNCV